jgi:Fe-S oxidoreductase
MKRQHPLKNKLSFKEKQFSKEFVETKGNGTEAAFRVYNTKNKNSAAVIASHNLQKPKVQQEIESLMEEGRLAFESFDTRVTYHDPCSLGRHANVYGAPRNVLNKIPKLQFVEMSLSKSRSRCCGGGGGLWSYNNRVSMNSASNRLTKDLIPINANVLATACPTCQMNLRYASIRNSIPVKVCDFAEIAEYAMVKS